MFDHLKAALAEHSIILLLFMTAIPIIFRDVLRVTHRCVGPLVSIKRALDDLAKGKIIEPVKLRKSDLLHDIADPLNKIADQIREFNAMKTANRATDESPAEELVGV